MVVRMNKDSKMLIAILVFALALRLPNLAANFTGDEIDIAGPARHFVVAGDFREFDDCLGKPYYNYTHPPMRLILYSAWASVFGFSNIALRLLPAIFGIASIAVIYLLGRELYSAKTGLIAAFLAAASRYHIYASNVVNTDTGHFVFFTALCALSFVVYKKRGSMPYLLLSFASFAIALLTKFSVLLILPPLLVYSFVYKKRPIGDIKIFLAFVAVSIVLLYGISVALDDSSVFTQPFASFASYASATPPTLYELLYNKAFYLASVSWQLTPFLAVLLLIALARLKKDQNYYFLASWLLVMSAAFFYTYRQDVQRFFVTALPPVFLLVSKYMEKISIKDKSIYASFAAVAAAAVLIMLNDMMAMYSLLIIAAFYLAAAAFSLPRYRKQILLGGFLALSVYSLLPNVTMTSIGSTAVGEMAGYVKAEGYDYSEVWTSKDIAFYIAPHNGTARSCTVYNVPDRMFLETNGVRYFAFYNVYEEERISKLADLCAKRTFVEIRNHTVGIVCEVS